LVIVFLRGEITLEIVLVLGRELKGLFFELGNELLLSCVQGRLVRLH